MASPALIYFAGIGTVVTALSVGFAGAMVFTYTTPIQKVTPAGFEKREQSVAAVPQAVTAPRVVLENPMTAASQSLTYAPSMAQPDVQPVPSAPQTAAAPSAVVTASPKSDAESKEAEVSATKRGKKSIGRAEVKSSGKKPAQTRSIDAVEKRKLNPSVDQKTKYAERHRRVIVEGEDADDGGPSDRQLSYDAPSRGESGSGFSLFGFLSED